MSFGGLIFERSRFRVRSKSGALVHARTPYQCGQVHFGQVCVRRKFITRQRMIAATNILNRIGNGAVEFLIGFRIDRRHRGEKKCDPAHELPLRKTVLTTSLTNCFSNFKEFSGHGEGRNGCFLTAVGWSIIVLQIL